jgi:hypothetical protein
LIVRVIKHDVIALLGQREGGAIERSSENDHATDEEVISLFVIEGQRAAFYRPGAGADVIKTCGEMLKPSGRGVQTQNLFFAGPVPTRSLADGPVPVEPVGAGSSSLHPKASRPRPIVSAMKFRRFLTTVLLAVVDGVSRPCGNRWIGALGSIVPLCLADGKFACRMSARRSTRTEWYLLITEEMDR